MAQLKVNNIAVALAVLSIGASWLGLGLEKESVVAINVLFYIGLVSFLMILFVSRENILYFSRLLLLGVIGYYPLFVKSIDASALFSEYEISSQHLSIVLLMSHCTSLALLGSYLGFVYADRKANWYRPLASEWHQRVDPSLIFAIGCIISLVVAGYMSTLSDNVFTAQYGTGSRADAIVGNLNSILNIGLFLVLISYLKVPSVSKLVVVFMVAAFAFVYAQILKGARQDVMSVMFGFFILYNLASKRQARVTWQLSIAAIPILFIFDVWGAIRGELYSSTIADQLEQYSFFSSEMSGIYHAGTISPVASTFANTLFMVQEGIIDLKYGMTYFEYILRSPPEFLYPDRPKDYAWIFADYGFTSGGGFFEIGEAYLNFGVLGAFVAPFILSFIIGVAYNKAFFQQSLTGYFFLFSFLAIWLRGSWYQTFAFYKAFLTAFILYFFISLFARWRNIEFARR